MVKHLCKYRGPSEGLQTGWEKLGGLSELIVLVLNLFNKVCKNPIYLVMRPQLG